MSPKMERVYTDFERKPNTELRDIAEIVRGILITQAANAKAQHTPPQRGTHSKGIAVRATFEVLDPGFVERDPILTQRLAQGIFAKPGTYPAIVRFANAASKIDSDSQADLRAMSFSVQVPAGVVTPEPARLDFSMQTATTFPINDAHVFAVLMRILSASSGAAKLKAIFGLSTREFFAFLKAAYLGVKQQKATPKLPYQQLRYWSTVPFRHGTNDAIKYSNTPNIANAGGTPNESPNWLQDDLAKHVNEDDRMPEFDFGVQLLDTERMTRSGRRRDPAFWIENATVEWNEEQAPFHTVAKLRLQPKSVLTPEETAAQYIDVTTNSLPDNRPIGGINRARWSVEHASRTVRQGGVVDMPVVPPLRRSPFARALRAGTAALLATIVLANVAGVLYRWRSNANVPPLEQVDTVEFMDQGWGSAPDSPGRQAYYYTAQGASVLSIPYSWFVNVERPFRRQRFADPDHMRQLRFLVDPAPSRANPDQLPVGFSRHYDNAAQTDVVDLTCAACHTGQVNFTSGAGKQDAKTTTAFRIDGGQAMMAVTDMNAGSFTMELLGGLGTTLGNPLKFNRFANRVLGSEASLSNKLKLWPSVAGIVLDGLKVGLVGGASKRWYPTQEGYGRTAAIGRIANGVFGDHLDTANYHTFASPESYPYLWNIWKFDWEQYGAFVAQPMARNAAEALGTGAYYALVDSYGRPVPAAERYRTSFDLEGVEQIERTLRTLLPPVWPQKLKPVDMERVKRGRQLFANVCAGCHGPFVASKLTTQATAPGKIDADGTNLPLWKIQRHSLAGIGTDPNVSNELVQYRVDMTRAGLDLSAVKRLLTNELETQKTRMQEMMKTATGADLEEATTGLQEAQDGIASLANLDLRTVSIGEGLNMLDMVIRERYYKEHGFSDAQQACYNGFGMLDLPDVGPGYKPRPLEAVWATPPFLHNGSVPTLYDMLSPVDERPVKFNVGRREYDAELGGYAMYVVEPGKNQGQFRAANAARLQPVSGEFLFDTGKSGNSNRGHEFKGDGKGPGVIGRGWTPAERQDLVEYLKVHRDDMDVVPYMLAHNGQLPPQQPAPTKAGAACK